MNSKHVVLLATGGTIAGLSLNKDTYQAGVVDVQQLLQGLPPLPFSLLARQIMALDSRDMTPQLMLELAREVMACLDDPLVMGVAITHGTDTLEESVFFLSRVLPAAKPVVFTAAMRPADSLSSDGPMNLYQALLLAGGGQGGVMALLNDVIYCAGGLRKIEASRLEAFSGQTIGQMEHGHARFYWQPGQAAPAFDLAAINGLAEVPLLYVYAGMPAALLQDVLQAGYPGLVLAAAGNGSVPAALNPVLRTARQNGVAIVLASRTGGGYVHNRDENFISAGWFTPLQARIMLQLGLAQGMDEAELGRLFARL